MIGISLLIAGFVRLLIFFFIFILFVFPRKQLILFFNNFIVNWLVVVLIILILRFFVFLKDSKIFLMIQRLLLRISLNPICFLELFFGIKTIFMEPMWRIFYQFMVWFLIVGNIFITLLGILIRMSFTWLIFLFIRPDFTFFIWAFIDSRVLFIRLTIQYFLLLQISFVRSEAIWMTFKLTFLSLFICRLLMVLCFITFGLIFLINHLVVGKILFLRDLVKWFLLA